MAENVKMEMSSLTTLDTCVIQITNVAPAASLEQMSTLFGFLGKIEEIKLYPSEDYPILPQSRVCYVKYADSWSTGVAQHLTNTVFVDRALIVVPVVDGQIPDESHAMSLTTPSIPGIVSPGPSQLINSVQTMGATQVFTTVDPNLTVLGLPQYPPLPANIDPSKIEEIRRTVYVGNLDSTTTTEQLLKFFNQVGEVKYVRMAGDETQPTRFAFVEFTDQTSVSKALQYNGIIFGSRPLKVNHSNNAIVKPQAKSSEAAQREIEEAMKRVREAQSLITAAIEPELTLNSNNIGTASSTETPDSKKKESRSGHSSRSRSRSRKRSRSKDRKRSKSKERRRSRSRGRRSASPRRSRSRGRRSTSRSRKKSPRKRSRSKERKSRRSATPRKSRSRSKDRKKRSRKSRSRTPSKSSKSSKSSRSEKSKSSPKRDKSPKADKSSPKKEKSPKSGLGTKDLDDSEGPPLETIKKEISLTAIPFLEDTVEEIRVKSSPGGDVGKGGDGDFRVFPDAALDKLKVEDDPSLDAKGDDAPRGSKQESQPRGTLPSLLLTSGLRNEIISSFPVDLEKLTHLDIGSRQNEKILPAATSSPIRSSKGSRSESKHKSPSHRKSHSPSPVKRKSRSPSSKASRRKSRSRSPSRKKRRSSKSPRRRSRSPRRRKGSPSPPPRRRSRSLSHSRSRSRSVRRKHRSPPRRRSRTPRRSPSYNRSRRRTPSPRRRSRTPRRRSRTPRKRSRTRTPPRKENKHKKKKDRDRSRDRDKKKSKHRTDIRSPEKDVQTDGSDTKVRRDYDEEEKGYDSSGNEDHRALGRDVSERGLSPGFDTPSSAPLAKSKKNESDDSDHRSQQMDLDSD